MANKNIAIHDIYQNLDKYWFQTLKRNPLFYGIYALALGRVFCLRKSSHTDWILWIYGATVLGLCIWHKQPWPYFFVILIPTGWVMAASLFHGEISRNKKVSIPLLLIFLAIGVGYPLRRAPLVLERDNGPQRNALKLSEFILGENDSYLAGINMIFNRKQPPGLGWLDTNRLRMIKSSNPEIYIQRIQNNQPKVYIENYRIRSLPSKIKNYLINSYTRLHGNVHIYCPVISKLENRFQIPFNGSYYPRYYRDNSFMSVIIDGKLQLRAKQFPLKKGIHTVKTDMDFRICLAPNEHWKDIADNRYKNQVKLFGKSYDY